MSLSYFTPKKFRRQSKHAVTPSTEESTTTSAPAPTVSTPSDEPAASPVLDEEDVKFLARLAAIVQEPESTPPPLPTRPAEVDSKKNVSRDAQEALIDGAEVPLPGSPPAVEGRKEKDNGLGRRKSVMGYFALAGARFKRGKDKDRATSGSTAEDKKKAADDLHSAAEASKAVDEKEKAREEQDLTAILDDLNLSAVNNRVFSFSKESEELFTKFKVVLKDIVSGAPTAYNDLEKLFTEYETTLKKTYGNLPPFLKNMVKSLPAKMTTALGPEILAATAEKPGFDAKQKQGVREGAKEYAKRKAKAKARVPSLKSLLSAEGAVATMLRSILNFLKLRFPAVVTGTNVVMSLAVCLLLFVLWYCHKRGREVRLENERLAAESLDPLASSTSSIASDADSIFASTSQKNPGESSTQNAALEEGKPMPPLVISGERESPELTVDDMPSVQGLPSPSAAK